MISLQHYGCQTPWIDITHDADTAPWFALHKVAPLRRPSTVRTVSRQRAMTSRSGQLFKPSSSIRSTTLSWTPRRCCRTRSFGDHNCLQAVWPATTPHGSCRSRSASGAASCQHRSNPPQNCFPRRQQIQVLPGFLSSKRLLITTVSGVPGSKRVAPRRSLLGQSCRPRTIGSHGSPEG
jgi:hypothetical protein